MIWKIALKEWRDLVRDGRFRIAGGVVSAFLLVSLGSGWVQYRGEKVEHDAAQAATRQQHRKTRQRSTEGRKGRQDCCRWRITERTRLMAVSNYHSSVDLKNVDFEGVIHEDVLDQIWNISHIPLPLTDAIGSGDADNTYYSWVEDELAHLQLLID